MIIDQNENITTITQENASGIELVKKIEALYPKFKNNNQINDYFSFKMLCPNLLTIQSIKNKKLVN